ncbi:MAG TPA: DUF5668 domain-containing protein [Thermoanaerobaculia bacterium]|nr:DUF5668 domain-containing protein [Thermoanaerobaculia bacterium]
MDQPQSTERMDLPKLTGGIILVVLGVAFLLHQIDFLRIYDVWRFWPLILIALGLARIISPTERKSRGSGVWLVGLGACFLIGGFGLFGLSYGTVWPLFLVFIGLSIVFESISHGSKKPEAHNGN